MNAIETRILELIGENVDSPDVYTDDDEGMEPIRSSISDAVQEIIMLTGGYKRQYFLPLRSDVGFYRLRLQYGDLGWITDVWSPTRQFRLEQTDITRLTNYDPRWMRCTGQPQAYCQLGRDTICLYPKPSGTDEVLEVTVVEIPDQYEGGRDRVKLRDNFKKATIHFAVAEYWASRGDANEAGQHMAIYYDALGIRKEYIQQGDARQTFYTHKESWPTVTS